MTTEDFEKIALWMGWELSPQPDGTEEWWGKDVDGLDDFKGLVTEITSLTNAGALEALNRLVEKGYAPGLSYTGPDCYDWALRISEEHDFNSEPSTDYWGCGPTIHEAVEAALLQLIAAEGGEGE